MKISRNHIALLIFFALIGAGFSLLVAYVIWGHNLNIAASKIDDSYGELKGYTVILAPGSKLDLEAQAQARKKRLSLVNMGFVERLSQAIVQNNPHMVYPNPFMDNATIEAVALRVEQLRKKSQLSVEAPLAQEQPQDGFYFDGLLDKDQNEAFTELQQQPTQETMRAPSQENIPNINDQNGKTIAAVADDYRAKEASVLVLNTIHPEVYDIPQVLVVGDKRLGILRITESETPYQVSQKVAALKLRKVDDVLAITPALLYAQQVRGITIALSLQEEKVFFLGEVRSGMFVSDVALPGSLSAIFITSAHVVSAKDI